MGLLNTAEAPDPLTELEDPEDFLPTPENVERWMEEGDDYHLDKFGMSPSREMIAPAERQRNIRQYRASNVSNARAARRDPPASGAVFPAVASQPETPSLEQFLTAAGPRNPHKSTRELAQHWNEHYGHVDPKTLPSLETFLPAAKEKNPSQSESALESYWQDHYGSLGAPEKNPGVAGAVTALPKMAGQATAAQTRR